MRTQFWLRCKSFEEPIGDLGWLYGRESNPSNALDFSQRQEKIGQIGTVISTIRCPGCTARQSFGTSCEAWLLTIGSHEHAGDNDLGETLIRQRLHFGEYLIHRSRNHFGSGIGDGTEGAKDIAAVLNLDGRACTAMEGRRY